MLETRGGKQAVSAKKLTETPDDELLPVWLSLHIEGKMEDEQALWLEAYREIHGRNYYLKGERPAQALARFKGFGMMASLSIDSLQDLARDMVKSDLGPDGGKRRNHYTVHDRVLDSEQEKEEVEALVQRKRKHLHALRLAPTREAIALVMTPDFAEQLKKCGLECDPSTLHDSIVRRLDDDRYLAIGKIEGYCTTPVGAVYTASGAISAKVLEETLVRQRVVRDAKQREPLLQGLMSKSDADFQVIWQSFLQDTDLGHLLREHFKDNLKQQAKLEAANTLIAKLCDR